MAIIQSGSFTSAGTAVDVNISDIISDFDAFHIYVQGDSDGSVWNSSTTSYVKEAHWYRGMASGRALARRNANGTQTDQSFFVASGGFVPYSYSNPPTYAVQAITDITKANPAEVTIASHGYATGDIVRIYNNVVMDQIAGLEWTITKTGANTFTIPINTNTANFAGVETGASAQKLFKLSDFYPQKAYVTGITAANPAVITTSTAHGYVAGQKIRVKCPSVFGMTQIDGLLATIASVTTTTITTDIDSSAFTAFAWPAATAVPLSYAEVHPVGESNSILTAAETNIGTRGMIIGATLQTASALTFWVAEKSDRYTAS